MDEVLESPATLAEVLHKQYPEAAEQNILEREEVKRNVDARESVLEQKELDEIFASYGVTAEVHFDPKKNCYRIPVSSHFGTEQVPEGYAYKGGAARALLLRTMGIDQNSSPRDIDVVRLLEKEPYPNADTEIAAKFMPDDFQTGYGVEPLESLKKYFDTRDFTCNEILATNSEIFTTETALLDTLRRIIRITPYQKSVNIKNENAEDKILAKTLRFYAESVQHADPAFLGDDEEYALEQYFISPFWLAVQLDRAYEQGERVAEEYVRQLIDHKKIPETVSTPAEAAEYLLKIMEKSCRNLEK